VKTTAVLLHAITRAALEVRSPLATKRMIDALGRWMRPIDADEARRELSALERSGRGTCLSRSLSVAARLRGSRVVIGVARPEAKAFTAHAWVEIDGVPIRDEPVRTAELARLG
jgi:hypothetical protein